MIGLDGYEKYESFRFENPDDRESVEKVIQKFDADRKARINIIMKRHKFLQRKQVARETINQFATSLRILANSCKNAEKNYIIRDQLILNTYDKDA